MKRLSKETFIRNLIIKMTSTQILDSIYNVEAKSMQQIHDEILDIFERKKEQDAFKGTFTIPKGTKRRFEEYINEDGVVDIPDNELFSVKIKPDDIFKGIYISTSGSHKSWQMKNDLFYFYHNNFNCGVIDTKNINMIQCKDNPSHNPIRLHPKMIKSSLPIYGLLPAFSLGRNRGDESLSKDIINLYDEVFAFSISSIETIEELDTLLGMTDLSSMALLQSIKNSKSLEDLAKKSKNLAADQSKKSLQIRFNQSIIDEVFTDSFDDVDLEKLWYDKKIHLISSCHQKERYLKYYVSKYLKRCKSIATNKNMNIFIQFEDASSYLNPESRKDNVAVDTVLTGLTDWRSDGFNYEFSIQNPNLIDKRILEECNHFFIGSLMNPEALRSYMSGNVIDEIQTLDYNDDDTSNKYVQYAYYKTGLRRPILYYPFQPLLYHKII